MDSDFVIITAAHVEMLRLSDIDIECNNLIPHEQLNDDDLKWLNGFKSLTDC